MRIELQGLSEQPVGVGETVGLCAKQGEAAQRLEISLVVGKGLPVVEFSLGKTSGLVQSDRLQSRNPVLLPLTPDHELLIA
jgi:hypothetical protein